MTEDGEPCPLVPCVVRGPHLIHSLPPLGGDRVPHPPGCVGCATPGHRKCCPACDDDLYRCDPCNLKHRQEVHGLEPTPETCAGCKKELGLIPPDYSPAGAPWCGECRRWWFGP